MSNAKKAPTAAEIAKLDDATAEARAKHEQAVATHARAEQAAESAAEHLAALEADAAKGEDVHPDEYSRVEVTARLAARRPAALAATVDETREALEAAEKAANLARARVLVSKLPDPAAAEEKAMEALHAYWTAEVEYSNAVREINDEARALTGQDVADRFGRSVTGFHVDGVYYSGRHASLVWEKFDDRAEAARRKFSSENGVRSRL